MRAIASKRLIALCAVYMVASLIHFAHNAEFLVDYPNLPQTWTRAGVYLGWVGMTVVGAIGLFLVTRGFRVVGLLLIAVYSILGMDSLGHYVVAPISAHTVAMNLTIMLEVSTAALVFVEVARRGIGLARDVWRRQP